MTDYDPQNYNPGFSFEPRSTMLRHVEWYALGSDNPVLRVTFNTGQVYLYKGVSSDTAKAMLGVHLAGESVGRWFNEHIKGVYPYA